MISPVASTQTRTVLSAGSPGSTSVSPVLVVPSGPVKRTSTGYRVFFASSDPGSGWRGASWTRTAGRWSRSGPRARRCSGSDGGRCRRRRTSPPVPPTARRAPARGRSTPGRGRYGAAGGCVATATAEGAGPFRGRIGGRWLGARCLTGHGGASFLARGSRIGAVGAGWRRRRRVGGTVRGVVRARGVCGAGVRSKAAYGSGGGRPGGRRSRECGRRPPGGWAGSRSWVGRWRAGHARGPAVRLRRRGGACGARSPHRSRVPIPEGPQDRRTARSVGQVRGPARDADASRAAPRIAPIRRAGPRADPARARRAASGRAPADGTGVPASAGPSVRVFVRWVRARGGRVGVRRPRSLAAPRTAAVCGAGTARRGTCSLRVRSQVISGRGRPRRPAAVPCPGRRR